MAKTMTPVAPRDPNAKSVAAHLVDAGEKFEEIRDTFQFYRFGDDDGTTYPLRGIVLARHKRPERDDDDSDKDQFFYYVWLTKPGHLIDRENVVKEYPIGTVAWVDEKHALLAMSKMLPDQKLGIAYEVIIAPIERVAHPKKKQRSIWRCEPLRYRKIDLKSIAKLPEVAPPAAQDDASFPFGDEGSPEAQAAQGNHSGPSHAVA